MNINEFIASIEDFGFEKVLVEPFKSDYSDEFLYAYFHKKYGVFLEFTTYGGNKLNGGTYYYQWIPSHDFISDNKGSLSHQCFSSGGFRKIDDLFYQWNGSGDCRDDAMISCIKSLSEDGKFITPWTCEMFSRPSLIHYMDHHSDGNWNDGYKLYCDALVKITPIRLSRLPADVYEAIKRGYDNATQNV